MESSAQSGGGRGSSRRSSGISVWLVVITSSAFCSAQPRPEALLLKLLFETSNKHDCGGYSPGPIPAFKGIARATPGGNLLWNSPVPGSFSPRPSECEVSSWVKDWHDPDDRRYDYETLGIYFAKTSDTLAFATLGNVFALSKQTGKVRFEWAAKPAHDAADHFFYFDDGTFHVRRGNRAVCAGKAGSARVFAVCENQFFYFDHEVAAVLDPSGKVIAETAWQDRFSDRTSTTSHERAKIPLGPYELRLEGMIFLR